MMKRKRKKAWLCCRATERCWSSCCCCCCWWSCCCGCGVCCWVGCGSVWRAPRSQAPTRAQHYSCKTLKTESEKKKKKMKKKKEKKKGKKVNAHEFSHGEGNWKNHQKLNALVRETRLEIDVDEYSSKYVELLAGLILKK